MDELSALAQLRPDPPAPAPETLAAIRARLVESAARPIPVASRRTSAVNLGAPVRHRPRRYVLAGVVGLAATVAVAVGAYALTSDGPSHPNLVIGAPPLARPDSTRPASPLSPPPSSPPSAPVAVPAHYRDAAQLLTIAAAAAAHDGDPGLGQFGYGRVYEMLAVDGNDQFSYASVVDEYWESSGSSPYVLAKQFDGDPVHQGAPDPTVPTRGPAAKDVTWYVTKYNGPQGELWPEASTCAGGSCYVPPASDPWADNPASAATLAALPRNPTALRASLLTWATADQRTLQSYGKHFTVAELAFDAIGHQLDSGNVPAGLRSALFEVTKTLPGITLTGAATNYAGQPGLGISVPQSGGTKRTMIFDHGGAYIGAKEVVVQRTQQWPLAPGTVVDWSAVQYAVTGAPALPPGVSLPR